MPTPDFAEIGRTGLNRFGGSINEEFLRQLQGTKAVKIYTEMRRNDPIVGAVLFAIEHLAKQVAWTIEPASESPEDMEIAEFTSGALFEDMSFTWPDTLSEILTMLPYGWSWFEVVYKRRLGPEQPEAESRSKFSDGRIGIRKLAIRGQDSLQEWKFDEEGGIQALVQRPAPDYALRTIPIEKSLLFRTKVERNNPEGVSVLRNAYRPWFFKKRIEEIEGIGIERDLAGLPMLEPPEGVDLWNSNDPNAAALRAEAEKIVRSIRRDEQEGVVVPSGWKLTLLTTGGRRQFDTTEIIQRYNASMALTVLADFILLGHEKVGSFALASTKTSTFARALTSFLDSIAAVINRHLIPRLLDFNALKPERNPSLQHGDIDMPDLGTLGDFIQKTAAAGMLWFGDDKTERAVRQAARMPLREDALDSE